MQYATDRHLREHKMKKKEDRATRSTSAMARQLAKTEMCVVYILKSIVSKKDIAKELEK